MDLRACKETKWSDALSNCKAYIPCECSFINRKPRVLCEGKVKCQSWQWASARATQGKQAKVDEFIPHPSALINDQSQLTVSILHLTVFSSEWHKFMLFFLKWKTTTERRSANRPGNQFQTCENSWGDLWSTVSIAHWRGRGKWIQISNDYAFDVSKLCIVCSMTSSKTYHGSKWRSKHCIAEFTVKDSCCWILPWRLATATDTWHAGLPEERGTVCTVYREAKVDWVSLPFLA